MLLGSLAGSYGRSDTTVESVNISRRVFNVGWKAQMGP